METFDINRIAKEIRTKTSITDKLNYWNDIKIKYIDEPLKKAEGKFLIGNSVSYERLTELFGKDYKVVSSLKIPQHIYNEHFSEWLKEPEFTYWFLIYNAKEYFESIYLGSQLDTKLSSPIAKQHIAADLKELNDFEKKAYDLLRNKTVDINDEYYNSEYALEIEFLRIKDDYYVKKKLDDVHSVVNTTVELYARHIYLKDFLETKLKELEASGNKSQTIQSSFFDSTKQLQNESTPLPKTSPSQHNYKKHPAVYDLIRLPGAVLEKYSICCEYRYIDVPGFGKIPVPLFAILGVEHHNIDIKTLPLKAYAEGFIQGYNSNLIPFIDSIDTRREVILHESIFKGEQGFEESHNEKGIEYKSESMFESGLFEGKRYKAWEVIFETPSAFILHFEPLPSQRTNATYNKTPSKEDDIKRVNEILLPFGGYWNREKIMNKKDFDRVKEYLTSIINNNSLPIETKQIPVTNVSTEFIRRTIYEVYKYLGKKNRNQFIKLIHVFKQFDNTDEATTNRKFSQYSGNYDNDIATMIAYE